MSIFRSFSGLSSLHRPVYKVNTSLGARSLFFNAKSSEAKDQQQVPNPEGPESKADPEQRPDGNAASSPSGVEDLSEETILRIKGLEEQSKTLLEKVKDIDDRYKRALAETENTRIRMRKQIDDAKVYGIQNFCKDLLDVADVLGLALDTVPKDKLAGNSDLKSLFDGVQMTEKQLQGVFARHGLTKINPIGQKFDPNEHHAMFEAPIEGKEPGTVSVVTKLGYKLKERTIRPAMVGVVKAVDK
jgi:molecular chaperone GrpE